MHNIKTAIAKIPYQSLLLRLLWLIDNLNIQCYEIFSIQAYHSP